jgi:uncharacterized membrane protein YphA (DoxX/SURF4 family)
MNLSGILVFLCRLVVGAIFVYTGLTKAFALSLFEKNIAAFGVLSQEVIPTFAIIICALEILLGITLILGFYTSFSAFGISTLTLIFTVVLINAFISGTAKECGCFGGGEAIDEWSIFRDIVLLAMSLIVMIQKKHLWSLDSWLSLIPFQNLSQEENSVLKNN